MINLRKYLLFPVISESLVVAMYSWRFMGDEASCPLMHGHEGKVAPECFMCDLME
jgi:hypothetical protein